MTVSGIPLATYRVQVNWWKKIGVADAAPLWTAADWSTQVAANGQAAGAYVDVTDYLDLGRFPITISRGKQAILGSVSAGTINVTLGRDDLNVFNPTNDTSPLNSPSKYVLPYCGVKVSAQYDPGTGLQTYPLALGWSQRVRASLSKRGEVVIPAVDLFDRLQGHKTVGLINPPGSTTAGVIAGFLAQLPGGWTYQDLDAGLPLPANVPLLLGADSSLLDAIEQFVLPTLGTFFIAKDGTATFRNKGASNHGGVLQATITNTMTRQEPEVDISNVLNHATATKTNPSDPNYHPIPQLSKDQTSIDRYGKRTWEMSSSWWQTDSAALTAASWITSHYKNPFTHVRTITVEGRTPNDLDAILKVDVYDKVQIIEGQTGTTGTYLVLGLQHTIGGRPFKHSVQWTLAPAGY